MKSISQKPHQSIPDLKSEVEFLKRQLADEQHKTNEILNAWKHLEEHRRYVKTVTLWELQ